VRRNTALIVYSGGTPTATGFATAGSAGAAPAKTLPQSVSKPTSTISAASGRPPGVARNPECKSFIAPPLPLRLGRLLFGSAFFPARQTSFQVGRLLFSSADFFSDSADFFTGSTDFFSGSANENGSSAGC
jgi:hypothetical protein